LSLGRFAAAAAPGAWLALVVLGACLLTASTWRFYGNTWDEPEHLAAGVELLDRGQYDYDTEHPPLGRVLLALGPYLAGARSIGTPPPDGDGVQEGVDILYGGGHYDRYLTLARLGALPFLALLAVATWLWARRLLAGAVGPLLAVLLLVSVPPVLGHAGIAALDVAAAATILLALYALEMWLSVPRLRNAVFFGLTAGLAVGTKFSAVPFLGLGLIVLGLGSLRSGAHPVPARARLLSLALAALAALVPLWLAYGPRGADHTLAMQRFDWAVAYLRQQPGLDHWSSELLGRVWLPRELQELVSGMVAVKAHNDSGHWSFLLGEVRTTGWWYFYPVALVAKTPISLLLTGPAGTLWLAQDGWRERDPWKLAPLLLLTAILVFVCSFSHINIGVRHVLVLYPLLALGGAYLIMQSWARSGALGATATAIAGRAMLVALIAWQLGTLWTAYPDYLPYFNEAVSHPERVLIDSDLDWGQDLRRLEQRAVQLQIRHLNLAYLGTADLRREPLPPFTELEPHVPVHGWVAVSELARTRDPANYAWLDAYRPLERVGRSIELYYIP
jgi:4-amino-4-deoxy-L-arabinose transferase-like glycosyltransferase